MSRDFVINYRDIATNARNMYDEYEYNRVMLRQLIVHYRDMAVMSSNKYVM